MIASQLFANGLISGSIIALVAVGFSLIYVTNRFAHFAHGAVVAAAGYLFYTASTSWNWPVVFAVLFSLVGTTVIGVLMFVLVYGPLKNKKSSSVILLIASVALMIFTENVLLRIYGASVKSPDVLPVQRGIEVLGAIVTPLHIVIIGFSLLFFVLFLLFVKKSKMGKLMRAVADNSELAKITGIHTRRIQIWSFALGSAMASVAGMLIAMERSLLPSMGTNLIIKGFTGAVIGGVSSVPGAILGSYLLGLVENIGIWYLPSAYKEAIAFVLLLIFLLCRPQGIFGIYKGTKE